MRRSLSFPSRDHGGADAGAQRLGREVSLSATAPPTVRASSPPRFAIAIRGGERRRRYPSFRVSAGRGSRFHGRPYPHCDARPAAYADPLAVKVGVIRQTHTRDTVSILDIPRSRRFRRRARSSRWPTTTRPGNFLDQSFAIEDAKLAPGEDAAAAAKTLLDSGIGFLIVDLPADALLKVADLARGKPRAGVQRRRARRTAARGGLPRQRHPRRAVAGPCSPTRSPNI